MNIKYTKTQLLFFLLSFISCTLTCYNLYSLWPFSGKTVLALGVWTYGAISSFVAFEFFIAISQDADNFEVSTLGHVVYFTVVFGFWPLILPLSFFIVMLIGAISVESTKKNKKNKKINREDLTATLQAKIDEVMARIEADEIKNNTVIVDSLKED